MKMVRNASQPVIISTAATEEINTTCLEFIARYYDALQAKPDAWPLDRFYGKTSKHTHLRFGKRPEETLGTGQIKSFVANMKFGQCDFAIDSIYARGPWPTRYTVFAVGRLSHPGRAEARKFTQTTVFVKFPPSKSTTAPRQYLILKTAFKFVDRVNDDVFFHAADDPKKEGPAAAARESRGKSTPSSGKRTAIAVNAAPASGDKRSSKKDSTDEKAAGTSCQTTVVQKNTKTVEPVKDESSNKLTLTPNEESTAPRKLSKNMRKKIKQLNESAPRAEYNIDEAKLPEKRSKKTKTKYTKLCEITEGSEISTILTGDDWQTKMNRKKNRRVTGTATDRSVILTAKETSENH